MKFKQNTLTKQRKATSAPISNMKGSRSSQDAEIPESDFEYYLSNKYRRNADKQLYFEKLLDAFRTLSEEAPEVFDSIAPEMLQRSIWSGRGADPLLSKKFNNWILGDYQWTPFNEILPNEPTYADQSDILPLNPDALSKAQQDFLSDLSKRFYGDPHRWDATTRDQFIILGLLAMAGGGGVRQGKLIHSLGMGLSEEGVKGSNTVRAAKIALSRLANPYGIKLFAPATGHGGERLHSFSDVDLAETVLRYVLHHQASLLLPSAPEMPSNY